MGEVLKISVLSLALNNVLPDLLGIKVHHLHRHVSNCLLIFTVSSVITKYVILEHLVLPNNLDAQSCLFVVSNSSVIEDSELCHRSEEQEKDEWCNKVGEEQVEGEADTTESFQDVYCSVWMGDESQLVEVNYHVNRETGIAPVSLTVETLVIWSLVLFELFDLTKAHAVHCHVFNFIPIIVKRECS